ncbi:hypothetical protein [uncultured Thiodictyon sp.]|uniref:hypothetical protein n=1 Tax=uncultured Thiodictyon sp. TaxID=1846217 RepID=UPI0025E85F52|nr:hypothetical protein [uncultured Thiodictyon sp.]
MRAKVKLYSGEMRIYDDADTIYRNGDVITIRSEDSILAIFREDDLRYLLSNDNDENDEIETPDGAIENELCA